MKTKKTLLEIAKEGPIFGNGSSRPVDDEEIDLAYAVLKREISWNQALRAMGMKPQTHYAHGGNRMFRALWVGIWNGKIIISKSGQ